MTLNIEGTLYQILDFLHVKPGKGATFMKMKLKNIRAGTTLEKTMNINIEIEKPIISKKTMTYLYSNGDSYVFMDIETYVQLELSGKQIENESKFLKENLEVNIRMSQVI